MVPSMNMKGVLLERALADTLTKILHEVPWLQEWRVEAGRSGWDLIASGPLPSGGEGALHIECKGVNFQPNQFLSLAERSGPVKGSAVSTKVLAMHRVSTRMAEVCQQHGWSWYDLAGNCRLEVPGHLLIKQSGNKPVPLQPRSGANLSTPKAAQVIRALLAPENAGKRWTQREMASHFTDVMPWVDAPSLALVNKVIQYLRNQAFIETLPSRGFRVTHFEGLLQAWQQAYRFNRHLRRPYFTLLQGKALQERLRNLDPEGSGHLAYAVFSAADIQAPAVRQPRTWLYLNPAFEPEFASAIDARLVDSGENIVALIPDDGGVFYRVETGSNWAPRTNPVQTYVDLANAGGRGEEAAEAILTQRLIPAWSDTQ